MFVKIAISNNASKMCFVSKHIFDSLNLSEKMKYTLHLGQNEFLININPDNDSKEKMIIPEMAFNNFKFLEDITLNIWRTDQDIFLGPITGIVENRKYINSIANGNLHIRAMGYSEESNKINCFTYFLSSGDVDLKNNLVKGCYFNFSKNKWVEDILPIPNVIYERASNVKTIFKDFKNIKYINNNDESIDKRSIYTHLSKYPEMKQYFPETIEYTRFEDVIMMLSKHNLVFLKSLYGASGIEVLAIKKLNRGFEVNFFLKGHQKKKIGTLSELQALIKEFFNKKDFIIQQGIKLLEYNGRKMDLRILIQRDKSDKWKVTAYILRLGKEDSPITNNCIGGEIYSYDEIYDKITINTNIKHLPTKKELGDKTINIASYIEKSYGKLGEIGMDIAIDDKGKVWFIEANLGPANTSPPELDEKETSNKFLTVLEYAMFLVGLNVSE